MITNDASCTREIALATAAVTSKLGLNLRSILVKWYIWSIAFMVLKRGHFGK